MRFKTRQNSTSLDGDAGRGAVPGQHGRHLAPAAGAVPVVLVDGTNLNGGGCSQTDRHALCCYLSSTVNQPRLALGKPQEEQNGSTGRVWLAPKQDVVTAADKHHRTSIFVPLLHFGGRRPSSANNRRTLNVKKAII